MRGRALTLSVLLAAALAGCGSSRQDPASTPTPSAPPTPSAAGSAPAGIETDPRVQAALRDAAGRAGIVPTTVVVAGYAEVTWSDGSLGCPVEGQAYPQALVEGELLLLRADQRVLSYHSGGGGPFEYCARPTDAYAPRP